MDNWHNERMGDAVTAHDDPNAVGARASGGRGRGGRGRGARGYSAIGSGPRVGHARGRGGYYNTLL